VARNLWWTVVQLTLISVTVSLGSGCAPSPSRDCLIGGSAGISLPPTPEIAACWASYVGYRREIPSDAARFAMPPSS
jgi:hypothetical protein